MQLLTVQWTESTVTLQKLQNPESLTIERNKENLSYLDISLYILCSIYKIDHVVSPALYLHHYHSAVYPYSIQPPTSVSSVFASSASPHHVRLSRFLLLLRYNG